MSISSLNCLLDARRYLEIMDDKLLTVTLFSNQDPVLI